MQITRGRARCLGFQFCYSPAFLSRLLTYFGGLSEACFISDSWRAYFFFLFENKLSASVLELVWGLFIFTSGLLEPLLLVCCGVIIYCVTKSDQISIKVVLNGPWLYSIKSLERWCFSWQFLPPDLVHSLRCLILKRYERCMHIYLKGYTSI